MTLRHTFSSGIVAALVARMLVGSIVGPAAAAEQLDAGVNTDADAAHNPYIEADVTKAVHEMGWSATEYENDNGETTSLPAMVNDTVANPYGFEASAYGAFPRSGVRTETDRKAGAVRQRLD